MSEIKVNKISPRSGTTLTLGDSGDDFVIPAGATLTNNGTTSGFASIAWQSSIVTGSTLTAVAGNGYWIDTTLNACTITLPASASVGDQLIFSDYARTWGTNAITINANSLNYQGYSSSTGSNPIYNTSGQSVSIIYSGATQGWIPTTDDDVSWKSTPPPYSIDFLVIAGGGGAAGNRSGGAGAGGYRNSYNSESSGGGGSAESSLTLTSGETYTITVGAGGTGDNGGTQDNGDDSSISGSGITTITSLGGGAGGTRLAPYINGLSGGSGGGGANDVGASGGNGTANQGYAGGSNGTNDNDTAAGGGGAGAVGNDGQGAPSNRGNGGIGVASTITGSSITRGGGGGGGGDNLPGGTGGTGGGGDGGTGNTAGTNGTANTGGGAGAGGDGAGGDAANGGSGVVILRMADADYSGTTTGSPTVTTGVDGTDTVLVFTGSGSYTA
jgi:hypothetical protein